MDTPFISNLVFDSEFETKPGENSTTFDSNFERRLRQENNSYYKTNNTKTFVVPTSCNTNYETRDNLKNKLTKSGSKGMSNKKSSNSRSRVSSNSKKRKCCKKKKEFNRILSEKAFENKPKSRNEWTRYREPFNHTVSNLDKLGVKTNRLAKVDLYQKSMDNKTWDDLSAKTQTVWTTKTRSDSLLKKEMNNLSNLNQTHQKKLITSLRNENSAQIPVKTHNLIKVSKRFDFLSEALETKMKQNSTTSMVNKFLKDSNKSQSRNEISKRGMRYSKYEIWKYLHNKCL